MKRMRWLISGLLVVLFIGAVTWAQDQPARDREGGRRGDRRARGEGGRRFGRGRGASLVGRARNALTQLELTDDQRDRIEKLRADFETANRDKTQKVADARRAMGEYRRNNPDDREGLREKARAMMEQQQELRQAEQGLVDGIKALLKEDQLKKFNELMAQGAQGGFGEGAMAAFRAMRDLGVSFRLMQDLGLTPEQTEKVRGLVQAYTEEQSKLQEKYRELIQKELTAEQKEKYKKAAEASEEMRQRFRGRMGGRGDRQRRGDRRRRDRDADQANPEEEKAR